MSRSLNSEAESLRQEIKNIIYEADNGDNTIAVDRLQSKDGRILYMGEPLGIKVGELMKSLGIEGTVCYLGFYFASDETHDLLEMGLYHLAFS